MPQTDVYFFQDGSNRVPSRDWLQALHRNDKRAWANMRERIRQLAQYGHELRRPIADFLRDGIYELRTHRGRVQHRLLYFFDTNKRNLAILSHGLIKEGSAIPPQEIDLAIHHRGLYESDKVRYVWSPTD